MLKEVLHSSLLHRLDMWKLYTSCLVPDTPFLWFSTATNHNNGPSRHLPTTTGPSFVECSLIYDVALMALPNLLQRPKWKGNPDLQCWKYTGES